VLCVVRERIGRAFLQTVRSNKEKSLMHNGDRHGSKRS
jgi:hypothetical protein